MDNLTVSTSPKNENIESGYCSEDKLETLSKENNEFLTTNKNYSQENKKPVLLNDLISDIQYIDESEEEDKRKSINLDSLNETKNTNTRTEATSPNTSSKSNENVSDPVRNSNSDINLDKLDTKINKQNNKIPDNTQVETDKLNHENEIKNSDLQEDLGIDNKDITAINLNKTDTNIDKEQNLVQPNTKLELIEFNSENKNNHSKKGLLEEEKDISAIDGDKILKNINNEQNRIQPNTKFDKLKHDNETQDLALKEDLDEEQKDTTTSAINLDKLDTHIDKEHNRIKQNTELEPIKLKHENETNSVLKEDLDKEHKDNTSAKLDKNIDNLKNKLQQNTVLEPKKLNLENKTTDSVLKQDLDEDNKDTATGAINLDKLDTKIDKKRNKIQQNTLLEPDKLSQEKEIKNSILKDLDVKNKDITSCAIDLDELDPNTDQKYNQLKQKKIENNQENHNLILKDLDIEHKDELSEDLRKTKDINKTNETLFEPDIKETNMIGHENDKSLEKPHDQTSVDMKNTDSVEHLEEKSKLLNEDLLDEMEKRKKLYTITYKNYFLITFSMIMYLADVLSDLVLGIRYFVQHKWVYAGVTMFFIIGSSVFYNFFNKGASWRRADRKGIYWLWVIPYFVLNGQPILQYVQNLKLIKRYLKNEKEEEVKKQIETHEKFIKGYKTAAALKNDEALWEAIPQTILQLFVLSSTINTLTWNLTLILQMVALLTSTGGLMATRFTYHRAFHFLYGERVNFLGCTFMATGYAVPLVCRSVAIASCISCKPLWCILILGLHWLGAGIFWYFYGWDRKGWDTVAEGLGLTLQPSFRNSPNCTVSSLVLLVEDAIFMVIWYFASDTYDDIKNILFTVVLVLDCIFRVVIILYWNFRRNFINKIL